MRAAVLLLAPTPRATCRHLLLFIAWVSTMQLRSSRSSTPPALPKTWGFNYDRTYPIVSASGEGDRCQMNLADIMALPADNAMQRAVDEHLHADFKAMKKMGGTAVRLYASLDSILTSATDVNATALAALGHIVDVAAAEGLLVDLTGANVMRNPPGGPEKSYWQLPAWLTQATDAQLRAAQKTFWAACATKFKGSSSILDFNLINEPYSESVTTADFSGGCLCSNTSAFGPSCHDCLCYSNHLQRAPYGKNFTKAWCREMSAAIKSVDPSRRVTLGDLAASLSPSGPPSCSAEDGLDYYSLHLYPHGNDTLGQLMEKWKRRIDTLPNDGRPVIIEEMYPLGGAPGISWTDLLQAYITSTSPRTVGYMSFFWGTAEQLKMGPIGASLYNKWLGIFSKGRPW